MAETRGDITLLLDRLGEGDRAAEEALLTQIYAELHRIAASRMKLERPDHTLQPTALVHEAYLRLCRIQNAEWRDRAHFFRVAGRLMRRILVDHARRHRAQKRNQGIPDVPFDEMIAFTPNQVANAIEIDEALEELAAISPRQAQIVEMRFFADLTEAEIAEVFDLSQRTIMRDWLKARAWLHQRLRQI